jgi:multiple sugar transport system ATP-binding protein
MATLTLENLVKFYGDVEALSGIDIEVADGEFVVLVGPSGCGKSTLLRCVAGLEKHSGGDIRLDGRSITGVPTRDRNVAMVFQSYALFPHLTVAENIGFGLRLRRTERSLTDEKVGQAARLLGLGDLIQRYPRELSGGQRQRVAMGRAIVRDAVLFLFDEPLSNLDAKLRVQMRTEIKALRQRLGTTSIYVTHDQDEAMTLADRIVVMNGGRVEQIGTPLELYDAPANLFVAGFMGSPPMNFIELTRSGDGGFFTATGDRVDLPGPGRLADGAQVTLGLRPEALVIDPSGAFAGTVEVVEPKGSETLVFVRVDEGDLMCVSADKRARFTPGEPVRVGFDRAEAHLFETNTGRRLGQSPGATSCAG